MRRLSIVPGLLVIVLTSPAKPQADFVRGDVDQNGALGLGDVHVPLLFAICCQDVPCLAAADVDASGQIDLTDVVRLLSFLYLGSGEIPAPFPGPGPGGPGDLPCRSYEPVPPAPDERVRYHVESMSSSEEDPLSFPARLLISTDAPDLTAWSVSLAAGELCQIIAASDAEAIEELESKRLFSAGFHKTELATGPGGSGLVSAVYPSFLEHRVLSPETGPQRILDFTWTPVFPARKKVCYSCTLPFTDGLQGSGQPVRNHVVLGGKEVIPSLKDLEVFGCPAVTPRWPPGDCNGDFEVDISDAVYILGFLFLGDPAPDPFAPCDADGNHEIQITDAVRILNFLFLGGPPPVEVLR